MAVKDSRNWKEVTQYNQNAVLGARRFHPSALPSSSTMSCSSSNLYNNNNRVSIYLVLIVCKTPCEELYMDYSIYFSATYRWGRYYNYFHSTDGQTKTQRGAAGGVSTTSDTDLTPEQSCWTLPSSSLSQQYRPVQDQRLARDADLHSALL